MEYGVQALADLSGVTPRTLRYYDKIGVLTPERTSASGYRVYGPQQVDRLQQILLYRDMGLPLADIKRLMTSPSFDEMSALRAHRERLLHKQRQLTVLLDTVEKTIARQEGRIHMTDREKFEGFKEKMLSENENAYGDEVRAKYGPARAAAANDMFRRMTPEQYEQVQALSAQLTEVLSVAMKTGDPAGALGQQAAALHKKWLCHFWPSYDKDAHAGLAQMYVDDERFTAYYDKNEAGTASFLRDCIHIYVKSQN